MLANPMPKHHLSNEEIIKKAIENQQFVSFTYEGQPRTVAIHHLGILSDELQVHAYQVSNGSNSGHIPGWKNFHVEMIEAWSLLDQTFTPEPTYHPENSHYTQIIKRIG